MKKKIITAIFAVSCVALSVGSVFAGQSCNGVTIVSLGSSTASASGLVAQVKNESGVSCGTLVNGGIRVFSVGTETTDRDYATLLTGFSLQKKFYINTLVDGANLDVLTAVVVKN